MHIYRWDLDRTYLETDIHSVGGLVRAALEHASSKRTVPGAGALVRGLLATEPSAKLVILSGSPLQMRAVLEEKLALDGVRVDRLILKDNLGNLRKGRLRDVRGQIGYKLPHLLEERIGVDATISETLFGDDSETDAVIYTVYAEILAGRMGEDELRAVLQHSRAYPDAIERALATLPGIQRGGIVEDVFIRIDRGMPVDLFRLLGDRVRPVFSWFQAALVLHQRGRLSLQGLIEVLLACGLLDRPSSLAGLSQDAIRRRL
ncbi:MAG TPA: hypothetical protein ENK18_19010, partial [Deltaproteobacteria bacterium]|nr:hypothetical protein [Deltaproteobacteria bacterium]